MCLRVPNKGGWRRLHHRSQSTLRAKTSVAVWSWAEEKISGEHRKYITSSVHTHVSCAPPPPRVGHAPCVHGAVWAHRPGHSDYTQHIADIYWYLLLLLALRYNQQFFTELRYETLWMVNIHSAVDRNIYITLSFMQSVDGWIQQRFKEGQYNAMDILWYLQYTIHYRT